MAVLAFAAVAARSVALAGFGLDSVVEIAAKCRRSVELAGSGAERQAVALRLIGAAFIGLAIYIAVQSAVILVSGHHAHHSALGIAWTAITAVVMFALAVGKTRTGAALGNQVLITEGKVTFVDGVLACAVLIGLVLNAALGWWWADPVAGFLIVGSTPQRRRTQSSLETRWELTSLCISEPIRPDGLRAAVPSPDYRDRGQDRHDDEKGGMYPYATVSVFEEPWRRA